MEAMISVGILIAFILGNIIGSNIHDFLRYGELFEKKVSKKSFSIFVIIVISFQLFLGITGFKGWPNMDLSESHVLILVVLSLLNIGILMGYNFTKTADQTGSDFY